MAVRSLHTAVLLLIAGSALAQPGGHPPDPSEIAKDHQVDTLCQQAYVLIRANRAEEAIPIFEQAREIERTKQLFSADASFEMGRNYIRMGRDALALDAYKQCMFWDSQKHDVFVGVGYWPFAMEYAILLARNGKEEEAKAMYYEGLRQFNAGASGDRLLEPAPFLVVFDSEAEGVCWDYTPQRLEAAALMLEVLTGNWMDRATRIVTKTDDTIRRIRLLAPDWFYPVLYRAAKGWRSTASAPLVDQADALAKPGLEKQLVAQYRLDLAAHKARNANNDPPDPDDTTPMSEGKERRARMQCLRPNEEVLRRISITR